MLDQKNILKQLTISIALLLCAQTVWANEPVAMITEIEGEVKIQGKNNQTADFGADLYAGNVLVLDSNARVSITYYDSCQQEWIGESSIVEVGMLKSSIKQGRFIKTEAFDCGIPQVQLTQADSHIKVGYVFRGVR